MPVLFPNDSHAPMLEERVARRCEAIIAAHGDWPCRAGCDDCCRSLAELPEMTEEEWQRLEAMPVPPEVATRIEEVLQQAKGPYVCPWLDRETGRCRVYEARPLPCRTYGFYVERDRGLYCHKIQKRVNAGEMAEVVWGNHEAVLAERGPVIGFRERMGSVR